MEATKCPHCRTWQPGAEPMHRGVEGRTLGGVCAALARQFGVDVALMRVGFVLALAFSFGTAMLVYLLLWVFLPGSATARPPVQRAVDWMAKVTNAQPDEPRIERRV